jgi:hypothetical protein
MHTLARQLAERHGRVLARGILEGIWHLAGQHAPDGDLSRFSPIEIAEFIGWEGDPDELVRLLVKTRWLDRNDEVLLVHDWSDHADGSVHKKLARARRTFATGEEPKLSYLGRKSEERKAAEDFYASTERSREFRGSSVEPQPEPRPSRSPAGAPPSSPSPSGTTSSRNGRDDQPKTPEDLAELWNEMCGAAGLPRVRRLTVDRRRKAAARLNQQPDLSYWRGVFEKLVRLPFCMGQVSRNGRGRWRATFDWIVKSDSTAVRVLEGNYSDPERPYSPL